MSVAYPLAFLLLLPALGTWLWFSRHPAAGAPRLPGDWDRLVERPLRRFMSRSALTGSPRSLILPLTIWVLLAASLSRPTIETGSSTDYTNIAGRVIAIDLGAGVDVHRQRLAVAELIEAMPAVPTALVLATADAFDAVPLTTDRAFLDRYLNVIHPDVMPLEGRSLATAIAHAEAVLTRAGVAAGQVVLLSGGEPPSADSGQPARWPQAIVVGREALAAWDDHAGALGARLASVDDLSGVAGDLEREIERASRKGDRTARFDLAPVLTAAALLLWLGLFRRRRTT